MPSSLYALLHNNSSWIVPHINKKLHKLLQQSVDRDSGLTQYVISVWMDPNVKNVFVKNNNKSLFNTVILCTNYNTLKKMFYSAVKFLIIHLLLK